ncbi:MAG TPA: LytTR family transcriptional regulator DNA-binding domain-containing protein [Opitutus sp.]|nr:LytTR family transcriptional regulator DNA-binding domain-containing protein [Opitutus sp.]
MPLRFDDTISLRTAGRAHFTSLRQIVLIAARDNYSEVTLSDGTRVVLRKSLKAWQSLLPESHFLRVHRMLIVNLTSIVRYERDRDEHTRLFFAGRDTPVAASRRAWGLLRQRLADLHPIP